MKYNQRRELLMKYLLLPIGIMAVTFSLSAQQYQLKSPDEQLSVTINTVDDISFSVDHKNDRVVEVTRIAMELDGGAVFGRTTS